MAITYFYGSNRHLEVATAPTRRSTALTWALDAGGANIGTINGSTISVVGLNGAGLSASVNGSTISVVGLNGAELSASVNGSTMAITNVSGWELNVEVANAAIAVTKTGTWANDAGGAI